MLFMHHSEQKPALKREIYLCYIMLFSQTAQIMIGLITLAFGIAVAFTGFSLGVWSGFFVWGALLVSQPYSVTELFTIYCSDLYNRPTQVMSCPCTC